MMSIYVISQSEIFINTLSNFYCIKKTFLSKILNNAIQNLVSHTK